MLRAKTKHDTNSTMTYVATASVSWPLHALYVLASSNSTETGSNGLMGLLQKWDTGCAYLCMILVLVYDFGTCV